jgi:hypothetical protein
MTNITNYNLLTINGLSSLNDKLSNITINNSIKIPHSASTTKLHSENSNAGIFIKDINSNGTGKFYRINVNSNPTGEPSLYFNNYEVIDTKNLLHELETILDDYPLETSNIIVKGGYINFNNGSNINTINTQQGANGVGLRYSSNNTVQFKNFDTGWIDLVDITKHDQFAELIDVDIYSNPLKNNQYITYNSNNSKFVNSNLSIIHDINPTLGSNLNVGTYFLRFNNTTNRFVYNSNSLAGIIDNNLLVLKNNTTITGNTNYLEINNNVYDTNPSIVARSSIVNNDVGITLETTGVGNIELNASNGGVYTNSDSLVISGFVKNSIYRTSTKTGGYNPNTPWNIPLTNDTILFDFTNSSSQGTYYANIGDGVDGQKLNLIYNNKGSNTISVLVDFTSNGIILGTGYGNGLYFDTIGQSSTLIYLGEDINAWQVLNTGSGVY